MTAFTCQIEAVDRKSEKIMETIPGWDLLHKRRVDEYLSNPPAEDLVREASAHNMSPAPRFMLESPVEYAGKLFRWKGYLWRKRAFIITVYVGGLRRGYEVEAASYGMAAKKVSGHIPVSASYKCDEL